MTSRPPGLHDVAAVAGVSHQTVSRVLNDHPHVSPGTREKVERAIAQLGYRRNMTARSLATGRSNVIGVVSPSSMLYGPSAMVAALGDAAREASMAVAVDHVPDLGAASVRGSVERLLGQGAAGLLLVLPLDSAVDAAVAGVPPHVPFVTVDSPGGSLAPSVVIDQAAGAALATRHLLGLGHDAVWHVAGPQDWNDANAREAGWRTALEEAGVDVPPVLRGDWSPASGYEAGRMLARVPECTAVFVANDHMALGLARALYESGRRLPRDVSLVGFDDVPEAEYYLPPLTTVHQDFAAVGRVGLELLLEQLARPDAQKRAVTVPAALIVRSSTAPRR